MKIFVDDIRQPPDDSWTLTTTISEAVNLIERYGLQITHISLDHDISIGIEAHGLNRPFPSPDTFQVVAKYMALMYKSCADGARLNWKVTTHSSNPDGRKAIVAILADVGLACEEIPLPPCARK